MRRVNSLDEGATIPEFALVIPLLILLVAGIIEWSLLYMTSHVLHHAAREGARQAVVLRNLTDDDSRVQAKVASHVANITVLPSPTQLEVHTEKMVDLSTGEQIVRVKVEHDYKLLLFGGFGFGNVTLKREALMRFEWP